MKLVSQKTIKAVAPTEEVDGDSTNIEASLILDSGMTKEHVCMQDKYLHGNMSTFKVSQKVTYIAMGLERVPL